MRTIRRLYLAIILVLISTLAHANRDPKQMSLLVYDFDGTLGNLGSYVVFRAVRLDSPFAPDLRSLPEEVRIPIADFESPTGLQIGKRLGRLMRGSFVSSGSLEPIQLSNGQSIVPGYYYLDPNRSYAEFGRSTERRDLLSVQVDEKIKNNERFLAAAYPFFAMAHNPKYEGFTIPVVLTMRGGESAEMRKFFEKVHRALEIPLRKMPDEAFVNLNHPDAFEFGYSKITFIRRAYKALSDRVIANTATPHFLFLFENDRKHLMDMEEELRSLSTRGEFANPVVPVLVNLVEKEVLLSPDGTNWDRNPAETGRAMARVNIYWPHQIERTQDLERVFELILGDNSKARYTRYSNKFMCSGVLK